MVTDLSRTYTKEIESKASLPEGKPKPVNLLVEIPPVLRIAIIVYFLLYRFFFPFKEMVTDSVGFEDMLIQLLRIVTNFIIFLPIMFRWKGIGLLHPLVWPTLFGIAKGLKDPSAFIAPFMTGNTVVSPIANQISTTALDVNLKYTCLNVVAILLTYLGYYVTNTSVKFGLKGKTPAKNIRTKLIIWGGFCLLVGFGFFLTQGGVQAWINNWGLAGGRTEAMEGLGPILSFIGGLYYIPTLWILVQGKKAIKDPFFIVFAIIFAICSFLATGSRYGVLQAVTTYLMAWVLINRDFPIVRVIIGGFTFLILFGVMGMLRSSGTYQGKEADWSVLNQDASSYLEYTFTEGAKRAAEKPDLAVMRKVPDQVDYLYGQSYLYLLSTYIPRAIWPDKPHSGAYYTGALIFNVHWGIPVGELGEVYWNFGAFGLMIFFYLKGAIYKIFVNTFNAKYQYAAVAVLYFMFLFNGGSFASLTLADFFREIIFLFIGLKFLRLI